MMTEIAKLESDQEETDTRECFIYFMQLMKNITMFESEAQIVIFSLFSFIMHQK